MKFTDGFWMLREGFRATWAQAAYSARPTSGNENPGLKVLATPNVVRHRGQTLNTATFDISLDTPLDDVIRVRVAHHKGGKPALKYPVAEAAANASVESTEEYWQLTSGALSARVHSGENWNLEFIADGKVIAHQRHRSLPRDGRGERVRRPPALARRPP